MTSALWYSSKVRTVRSITLEHSLCTHLTGALLELSKLDLESCLTIDLQEKLTYMKQSYLNCDKAMHCCKYLLFGLLVPI